MNLPNEGTPAVYRLTRHLERRGRITIPAREIVSVLDAFKGWPPGKLRRAARFSTGISALTPELLELRADALEIGEAVRARAVETNRPAVGCRVRGVVRVAS